MKTSLFFKSALCVIALMLLIALCSCGEKQIDFKDYITITYDSFDGYASPLLDVNYDALDKCVKAEKLNNFVKNKLRSYTGYEDFDPFFDEDWFVFSDFLYIDFDEDYNNLSNGDEIIVNVKIATDLASEGMTLNDMCRGIGIKPKDDKIKYKVKGLEKPKMQKVNVEDVINISFGKYNGYSTPTAEIDSAALSEFFNSKLQSAFKENTSNEIRNLLSGISSLADMFEITYKEAYNNISNGDKITVNFDIKPEFKSANLTFEVIKENLYVEFKNTEITYKVSGLENAKNVIDLFADVEDWLTYQGAEGHGILNIHSINIPEDYVRVIDDLYFRKDGNYTLKIIRNNKNIGKIMYTAYEENLSEGDLVEIRADSLAFGDLEDLGYIIPNTRTNLTVPDIGEYLSSKKELKNAIIKKLEDEAISDSGAVELCKLYYANIKPGYELDNISGAAVTAIVKKSGFLSSGYYMYSAFDIIIKGDEIVAEFEPITSWAKDSIEEVENSFSNSWEFELINDYTQK